jgi:alpha-galactosidase/6-phospho-beta-glucosidase family protein
MPHSNPSIKLRSGSRIQTILKPIKMIKKGGKQPKKSNNNKDMDSPAPSDSDKDEEVQVIGTKESKAESQKRKLNENENQNIKTWKAKNPRAKYKVVDRESRN